MANQLKSARGNRALHFKNLNLYSTAGYAAYKMDMQFWEIDEAIFDEAMNMLPPMYVAGGFMMSEALCDTPLGESLRSFFVEVGGRYWCGYCTWREATKLRNIMSKAGG